MSPPILGPGMMERPVKIDTANRPSAGRMALYGFSTIISGWLSGDWGVSGGIGARPLLLSTYLETCLGNIMDVMARFSEEETFLLARMARSCAGPQEVRRVLTEPARGKRLRRVDGQRRSNQPRQSQAGNGRDARNNPPPSQGSAKGNIRGQPGENGRKRHRKGNSSEPRTYGSSSSFE